MKPTAKHYLYADFLIFLCTRLGWFTIIILSFLRVINSIYIFPPLSKFLYEINKMSKMPLNTENAVIDEVRVIFSIC